jgi:hypothetical protein
MERHVLHWLCSIRSTNAQRRIQRPWHLVALISLRSYSPFDKLLHTAIDGAVGFSCQSSSDGCTWLCPSVHFEIDHPACPGSVWRSNICEILEYLTMNNVPLCAVLALKGKQKKKHRVNLIWLHTFICRSFYQLCVSVQKCGMLSTYLITELVYYGTSISWAGHAFLTIVLVHKATATVSKISTDLSMISATFGYSASHSISRSISGVEDTTSNKTYPLLT